MIMNKMSSFLSLLNICESCDFNMEIHSFIHSFILIFSNHFIMVRAIVNPEETHTQTQGERAQKHHKDSNQSTGLNQTPNPTFSNDDMILKSGNNR